MKLYVANTTHQVQDFQYRLPDNLKIYKQTIDIGKQVMVPGDLSSNDVDFVVAQHAMYGMVNVRELDRTRNFFGLCYSIDKPVDVERVKYAVIHNKGVLVERGKEIRKEAAVAVNNSIEEQTGSLNSLQMDIEEIETKGKDTEVSEKIKVSHTEEPTERVKRAYNRRAV